MFCAQKAVSSANIEKKIIFEKKSTIKANDLKNHSTRSTNTKSL